MSDFDTVRDGLFPRITPVDCGNCRGCRTRAALDRIEAQLARLREERDQARRVARGLAEAAGPAWTPNLDWLTQENPE